MLEKVKKYWALIREISGDDAYERYLAHHRQYHFEQKPLSRKAFFIQQQDKKWSRFNRCC